VVNFTDRAGSGGRCTWYAREFYKPIIGIRPEQDVSASWVGLYLSDTNEYDSAADEDQGYLRSVGYLSRADGYRAALGFVPAQQLTCDTPTSEKVSFRLLGHVATRLAELLHSYVDLGGAYFPPMDPSNKFLDQDNLRRMAETRGEIVLQPWSHTGPGQIVEVFFSLTRHAVHRADDGRLVTRLTRWYSNVVDPAFLQDYARTGNLDRGR
jgi:hypothetical protein